MLPECCRHPSKPNNDNDKPNNDNDKANNTLAPLTAMPSREVPNFKFGKDRPGKTNNKQHNNSSTSKPLEAYSLSLARARGIIGSGSFG